MKILGLIVLAALCFWLQPWAGVASARVAGFDGMRGAESGSRCPSGYHKSTVTARCVRNGFRLPRLF